MEYFVSLTSFLLLASYIMALDSEDEENELNVLVIKENGIYIFCIFSWWVFSSVVGGYLVYGLFGLWTYLIGQKWREGAEKSREGSCCSLKNQVLGLKRKARMRMILMRMSPMILMRVRDYVLKKVMMWFEGWRNVLYACQDNFILVAFML